MQIIIDFLKSDICVIAISVIVLILVILFIANSIRLKNIQKKYKMFLDKLGTGKNIEEDLQKYIQKVELVENSNIELKKKCNKIEENIVECIQKVGIVRYTAFENIWSDLSFTLALLDKNDDGVVLNGIYSGDMSNIYAKPVKNGESTYTLSEQEKEAIKKAVSVIK